MDSGASCATASGRRLRSACACSRAVGGASDRPALLPAVRRPAEARASRSASQVGHISAPCARFGDRPAHCPPLDQVAIDFPELDHRLGHIVLPVGRLDGRVRRGPQSREGLHRHVRPTHSNRAIRRARVATLHVSGAGASSLRQQRPDDARPNARWRTPVAPAESRSIRENATSFFLDGNARRVWFLLRPLETHQRPPGSGAFRSCAGCRAARRRRAGA